MLVESILLMHTKSYPNCTSYPNSSCRSTVRSQTWRLETLVSVACSSRSSRMRTVDRALETPGSAARSIVTTIHTRRHALSISTLTAIEHDSIACLTTAYRPHCTIHVRVETIRVVGVRKAAGTDGGRIPSLRGLWLVGWVNSLLRANECCGEQERSRSFPNECRGLHCCACCERNERLQASCEGKTRSRSTV